MTEFIAEIEGIYGQSKAKAIQLNGKVVLHEGKFDKAKDMAVKIIGKRW
jgi:hypothetical protein